MGYNKEQDAGKLIHFCHPHLLMLKCLDETPPPCSGHSLGSLPWMDINSMPSTELPDFINHPAHPSHNLVIRYSHFWTRFCNGCRLKIDGYFYHCDECDFDLHAGCASLPQLVTNHPSHPDQPLSLLQTPADASGTFHSNCCGILGNSSSYHCHQCNFNVHVICPSNQDDRPLLPRAPIAGDYGRKRRIAKSILKGVVHVADHGAVHIIQNL